MAPKDHLHLNLKTLFLLIGFIGFVPFVANAATVKRYQFDVSDPILHFLHNIIFLIINIFFLAVASLLILALVISLLFDGLRFK